MKLIAINGAKYSKKDKLAFLFARNSDCVWVHPYTDDLDGIYEYNDEYIHMNYKQLSDKMERENPLAMCEVKGYRYVFFENQFRAGYCVILADDRIISYLKKNWDGDLITIRCHSNDEDYSERSILADKEFDIVFNIDTEDYDDLEAEVVYDQFYNS